MKALKSLVVLILVLFSNATTAQERLITGIVSDNLGTLTGVNVAVKGTATLAYTDSNGRYTITAKSGDVILFSYIGYETKSVNVATSTTINVQLIPKSTQLNEIVTSTGYSTNNDSATSTTPKTRVQNTAIKTSNSVNSTNTLSEVVVTGALGIKRNKKAVTYSQQQVSRKELNQAANPNVIQALAGKVSGLQVNTISNGVNAQTRVELRGKRSISGNNQALIVIDNVVSSAEILSLLPPEIIDTISVIKGASGAALYGEQGANGVLIVNTKKGVSTKTSSNDNMIGEKYQKPEKVEVDQEEYENFSENQFESPQFNPLSTFSIDVDNASYTTIRRFINNGVTVPKDAVRIEEMVNFFKYNYPQPTDDSPFSINTEYGDCPWNSKNKLLRIGLQGKALDDKELVASNFVFLIDVSGSMSESNKLPLLKQSLKIMINKLRKEDKIALVVYAGAAGLVLPSTSGEEKTTIINALDKLTAGGSTAGGAGIELAYKIAQENFVKNGNNRVILATDGDFNVGASSNIDMQTLIEQKRKSGVFLTCLGFGMGNYKDDKMELLADKGNGNYAYVDNIQEANRFLGKEFKGSMYAIAKDVKIQIEFNPLHVASYRLIGYENRKLNAEDFQNDAIDAGELGSGHTVTALYEITPKGVSNKFYEKPRDLKYSKTEISKTTTDELATIKFRYKKPQGEKSIEIISVISKAETSASNSSSDFNFSAAVAWFGLKLRDSKLVTNKATQDILQLANLGIGDDNEGYRKEFVRLVENVK